MTIRPKSAILASLLERGIPDQWATDEEAAALSGMCFKTFRDKREDLEARGFPKADPFNGRRFIPAILDFWNRRAQPHGAAPAFLGAGDEREKEKWDA